MRFFTGDRFGAVSYKERRKFLHLRKVLDNGSVELMNYMGSDQQILQAARVSTGVTPDPKRDRGLIRYLWRNKHSSPFEMAEFVFHIKAPIFVARQWHRHRTASINEASARYKVLPTEGYVPEEFKLQSNSNHQGASEDPIPEELSDGARLNTFNAYAKSFVAYDDMIEAGIAREQARIVMPVGQYTEWYWKMDLHNLFHFLELRLDPHAQYEIRVYAEAILSILKDLGGFEYSIEIFEQTREVNELLRNALNKDKEFERIHEYLRNF